MAIGTRPLDGIKVLEFGQIAAGPFAGSLFADLGADVVKVERPDGGDGMRSWPPLSSVDGREPFSENFASLNRNKRSFSADLKNPKELHRLRRLAAKADVVIENYRAGVLQRLGLGYPELSELNPRLVYCSLSGYGQTGPYASKGAFDVTMQAASGVMSVTGEDGAPPVKCGVPVGDFAAGLYAAYTILAALLRRNATGKGGFVDCSMLGSLIGIAALQTSEYFGTGEAPKRMGSAHPRNAPYKAFRGSDAYFVVAAGNDKLWQAVCDVIGEPPLANDPRFTTQSLRARNQAALDDILSPHFLQRSANEWLVDLDARGIPCAPINDYSHILDDPHVREMRLVRPLTLPNGVETRTTSFPIGLSDFEFEVFRAPPELGADTESVRRDWLGDERTD